MSAQEVLERDKLTVETFDDAGAATRGWIVPAIIGSSMLMLTLESTIMSNALPSIAHALHEDPLRLNMAKPNDHIILPDVISKEPLAPVVRQRDDDWMMIVKWTLYAMIDAEELGVNSKNIDEALKSKKPEVMRLVGTEGSYGEDLGLTKDWAVRIIRHVGNYGEVYDRNVGAESKLHIPRGMNQLWNAGGIQYAPPIR